MSALNVWMSECAHVHCLYCSTSLQFTSLPPCDSLTQKGRGLTTGWDGGTGLGWSVCVFVCWGRSLVATVSGNKGAAYFPQIADLPEPPVDTFQEPWMAAIVGRPGLRPEQTGLHQLCFWAASLTLPFCLYPSNVAVLSLALVFFSPLMDLFADSPSPLLNCGLPFIIVLSSFY